MRRLALLGVGVYLVVLLVAFPPALALRWLAPPALRMQSPLGSLWAGEAQAASYQGYYLGKTQWSMRPLALLRGRLAYHVAAQGPEGSFIDGVFALGPGGVVHIDTLTGAASVQSLASIAPPELPLGLFTGRAQLKLDELWLESGWPRSGKGQVELVDVVLTTPPEPLGSYEIELPGGDGGPLRANFHDTAHGAPGPVEIKGTLTLNSDRTYAVQCTAQARPNASDNIKSSLDLICPQR